VPHTFTARLGLFEGNDPAGTEIAWRGWDVGSHVAGLTQKLRLPDLPVYRPDGAIPRQTRNVHDFREIDHRPGLYGALGYSFESILDLDVMHYDNRGDPLRVKDGQYSWHTQFDHLGARLQLPGNWELLSQAMRGSTLMGPNAVHVRFASWYGLASHRSGPSLITLRFDWFNTKDRDVLPDDANGEHGHALALAWSYAMTPSVKLVTEALRVQSTREARTLIGERPRRTEDSLALELRWAF
jgi:hypothetical protein